MKPWLPILVEELQRGRSPLLAVARTGGLARAALFSGEGSLLAGQLDTPAQTEVAGGQAALLQPGESRSFPELGLYLIRPAADEAAVRFWSAAAAEPAEAWAAWLLVMPGEKDLQFHLLSAFGLWNRPRLPEGGPPDWSLLPINPGLGRLFIFGDDLLARETAALAGRTGLTVTWFSTREPENLEEALAVGCFTHKCLPDWDISEERLQEEGVRAGVLTLLTLPGPEREQLAEKIRPLSPRYLGPDELGTGLFPQAVTTSQSALGLIVEMLK